MIRQPYTSGNRAIYDISFYFTIVQRIASGPQNTRQSTGVTIQNNRVKGNVGQYGICVSQNSSALLEQNRISAVKKHGIYVNEKSVSTIKKNKISNTQQSGIYVNDSSSALMQNNTISSVKEHGIYVNQGFPSWRFP